ncbi:MAG: DUF3488 and transglutaminase-like domain-containing protein [Thermodesulfovibrio sp.]|nr:DUF3488 and transglutaminase-like domain-containing protein [Thermodesulfovibrio sp.]
MLLPFIKSLKTDNIIYFLSFFIVIVAFSGIISYIPITITVTFIMILLLSLFFHIRNIHINQWIINVLSLFFIVYSFLGFSIEDIVLPSVEALTLISAIRFWGKKTWREYFQIYLLAMLLLGASALFSISWFFLVRLVFIFMLTVFSILLITYVKETSQLLIEKRNFLELLKYSLLISILSIPLSILFFLFLPRTPYPLFDIGLAKSKTGFSSIVSLGTVSSIEEDRTVVMRVSMNKINENQLYWRMITFDTFSGRQWIKDKHLDFNTFITGQKIRYTIVFEPSYENYLPVLDFPATVYLKGISIEHPGIFKTESSIERQLKYTAESYMNFILYEAEPSKIYLQIPQIISEKFKTLTDEITKNSKDEREIIEKILIFLSNYEYSLKTLPKGNNPVEDFIFNTKKGNCEYFATSMALMLRLKGIPSRVVGGFRGGSYNNFGGYYIVRASDAHLWVEAWIKGQWIRLDPSGSRPIRVSEPIIFNFLDYLWNNVVVNYDFKAQLRLTKALKKPDIKLDKIYLIIPLAFLFLFLIFKGLKFYHRKNEPLNRFLSILKKAGIERKDNLGLEEFIMTIDNDALREKSLRFVEIYYNIYFKDKKFKKSDLKSLNKISGEIDEIIKSTRSYHR